MRKVYSSAFVLDRGKLSRIVNILEQRMGELAVPFEPTFELKLRNGRELSLRNAQEVLALDNPVKNPVVRMDVRLPRRSVSDGSVAVHFDTDRESNVSIAVTGPSTKWATEVFAEIEEQVERTFSTNWIHRFFAGHGSRWLSLALPVLMMIVSMWVLYSSDRVSHREGDRSTLLQRAHSAKTDGDRLQVVFDKTVQDLSDAQRRASGLSVDLSVLLSWRSVFIALPVIVVVGAAWYLASVCYPWGVFAWGDWEQEYSDIVGKRRLVWTVVIVAVVLGIITNLFVLSLPTFK